MILSFSFSDSTLQATLQADAFPTTANCKRMGSTRGWKTYCKIDNARRDSVKKHVAKMVADNSIQIFKKLTPDSSLEDLESRVVLMGLDDSEVMESTMFITKAISDSPSFNCGVEIKPCKIYITDAKFYVDFTMVLSTISVHASPRRMSILDIDNVEDEEVYEPEYVETFAVSILDL